MMVIMRYPEGHKQTVRERIVEGAAGALRRRGLSGVSIPELMKSAGLTHGGFYAHFESRDDLVAEAVRIAAADTEQGVFGEEHSLEQAVRHYLSPGHLDHPERGCVLAALGSEGARQPRPVLRAFARAARGLLRLVERKLHPRHPSNVPSDEALRMASTLVGAVILGRLVDDSKLAARILSAGRRSARN